MLVCFPQPYLKHRSIKNNLTPNAGLGKTFDFLHLWEMLKRAV